MDTLITAPNFDAPDDFYEALIDAHRDLSTPDSHALNARLVLLLANHIGRQPVLLQALKAARDCSVPGAGTPSADTDTAVASEAGLPSARCA